MSKAKRNALFLLCVVTCLILFLAMSLPTMKLAPGEPFSLGQVQSPIVGASGTLPGGSIVILFIRGMVALAIVFFVLYVLYSLVTAEGRKRLIADLIVLALLFLLASYLQKLPLAANIQKQEEVAVAKQTTDEATNLPESVFTADPPVWLTPAVIVIGSILMVIIVLASIRFFRRAPIPETALDELAKEAQNAIEALNLGGNLQVTVIHCYREMTRIVKQQKGIERESAMTVREFEVFLVDNGLPKEAIQTLSRLFEQVRYGGTLEDTRQEELALSCLTDIVNACKALGALP